MNILKYWGWALLTGSACLWLYTWLEGPPDGPVLLSMDNIQLTAIILSMVCLLLATTMWVIYKAFKEK